jgi:putative heme-binding domain-containing protein
MPGGNYGYHPRGPGQSHWHEEQPGIVPKILRTGFGSPTGMCVYEGTLLPKKYWGQILHTDAGPREFRCYHLKPQGAGYEVEKEVLATSTDTWFRPSDVCVAPDGSLFIADWYDPGVGGHAVGDLTHGRIYRLAPKGSKYRVPKVDLKRKEGVIAALASPNQATRYMALSTINGMAAEQIEEIVNVGFESAPLYMKARLFWAITPPLLRAAKDDDRKPNAAGYAMMLFDDERKAMMPMLFRLDRQMTGQKFARLLTEEPGKLAEYLKDLHLRKDAHRELLLTIRDIDPKVAKPIIYAVMKHYDGKDRFYLEAIGIAVGHHDKKRREIILADFAKQFPEWNDKVADLVWELRPPAVLATLGQRLADTRLTAAQRGRIVDILAASDDPSAGKALLDVLQADVPGEVRDNALANLQLFLPGKWRALRSGAELDRAIGRLLDRPQGRVAGLALIAAAGKRDAVPRVKELAEDDKQPAEVRRTAVQTLGRIPGAESVAALAGFVRAKKGPLAVEAVQGLGNQFPLWQEGPGTRAALKVLQDALLDKDAAGEVRSAALVVLAGSRPGSAWLLEMHAKKQLPEELKADAARLLRNSPYEDLRSRAHIAFPPPVRLDPRKLPSIAALAARKGDAERGKQLIAASAKNDMQCLKCHTIQGTGGQIGPDLSLIGKKASKENLLESILQPSKAIADQYLTWQIETKRGLSLTGLLVEETPTTVTLRDGNGKDTRIDKKDIDSREKSPKSLMPEDLLAYMTEDDLVDIVAYLFELK